MVGWFHGFAAKKGKSGEKPTVSARGQYGISMLTMYKLDMMNAAELLGEMRRESKDMTALISGLTEKMQGLSVPDGSSADKTLEEIRALMTGLNDQVKTVSDTLARLSEEA